MSEKAKKFFIILKVFFLYFCVGLLPRKAHAISRRAFEAMGRLFEKSLAHGLLVGVENLWIT